MSSVQKDMKKTKAKVCTISQSNKLADELKVVIQSLNQFLKRYFDKSITNAQNYAQLVKQYFIEQSTNASYSCAVSSLFSKISNMLQPFIQIKTAKYDISEQKLKQQISNLTHKIQKQGKKIKTLKQELNKYKEVSNRLTNFVYMLKINNIDVDLLYEKGCEVPQKKQSNSSEIEFEPEGSSQFLKNKQIIGIQNYDTR